MEVLGVDIGGSGIKGAIVDTKTGEFVSDRFRIPTPEDTSPPKILSCIHKVVNHFSWKGPIGIAFPEPVRKGIVVRTANFDDSWESVNAGLIISELTDCEVSILNDADAAGIAEVTFGAGRDENGLVMVLTVGTGIGSALFYDGKLIPNTELGHVEIKGITAENRASETARQQEGLKRKMWAKRLELVLWHYEKILNPDLFILSGGMSNKADKVLPFVHINTRLVAASFMNNAGMVGAALHAAENTR
jgi:polyphosphate glucokinase